jgi:hypothetical protein
LLNAEEGNMKIKTSVYAIAVALCSCDADAMAEVSNFSLYMRELPKVYTIPFKEAETVLNSLGHAIKEWSCQQMSDPGYTEKFKQIKKMKCDFNGVMLTCLNSRLAPPGTRMAIRMIETRFRVMDAIYNIETEHFTDDDVCVLKEWMTWQSGSFYEKDLAIVLNFAVKARM